MVSVLGCSVGSRLESEGLIFPRYLQHILKVWLCLTYLGAVLQATNPEDLHLELGSKTAAVKTKQRGNKTYVSLKDVTAALRLEGQDFENRYQLSGPRGNLTFLDDRSLVHSGGEYLLMSSPSWKKGPADWYVPEDFLDRALALVLAGQLIETPTGGFHFEFLEVNEVHVEVTNYPNYVNIQFSASEASPIRVRELQDYLEVEFGPYRIDPHMSQNSPSSRLISSMEFNLQDLYGTLQIYKGDEYRSFRELDGKNRFTRVLEIHGMIRQATGNTGEWEKSTSSKDEGFSRGTLVRGKRSNGDSKRTVVIIDPGHGGGDSGGVWEGDLAEQGFIEKDLTLQIALKLKEELQNRGLEIILTRDRDVSLSDVQRSSLANSERNRVFISLHVGSASDGQIRGGVVYVHGVSQSNVKLESRSGLSDLLGQEMLLPSKETDLRESQVLVSKDSLELKKFILWEMGHEQYQNESQDLAKVVQGGLNHLYSLKNRVLKVPLAVLQPLEGAGVLVEMGFLTNSEDRKNLAKEAFHRKLVTTLTRAIIGFFEKSSVDGVPE